MLRSLPLAVLIQSAPCEIQILVCRAYRWGALNDKWKT